MLTLLPRESFFQPELPGCGQSTRKPCRLHLKCSGARFPMQHDILFTSSGACARAGTRSRFEDFDSAQHRARNCVYVGLLHGATETRQPADDRRSGLPSASCPFPHISCEVVPDLTRGAACHRSRYVCCHERTQEFADCRIATATNLLAIVDLIRSRVVALADNVAVQRATGFHEDFRQAWLSAGERLAAGPTPHSRVSRTSRRHS